MTESITWDELRVVAIQTTDAGPYLADVFWQLGGRGKGCIIPLGATGEDVLLEKLQELPGFNNELFINAMSCAENRTFICWQKDTT